MEKNRRSYSRRLLSKELEQRLKAMLTLMTVQEDRILQKLQKIEARNCVTTKKQSLKKKDRERKAKAKPLSKTLTKMLSKASPSIVSPTSYALVL